MKRLSLLCCIFTGFWSVAAFASLVAFDDFESYSSGSGLAGNNSGTGWGGAWAASSTVDVETGGLSYSSGSVVVSGGSRSLEITPNEGGGITDGIFTRALGASINATTVYMSLLFSDTLNDDAGGGGVLSGSNDFIQFGLSTGTSNPESSVLRRNNTFQSRSTTGASNSADSGTTSVVGQTYFLVYKAERGGGNYTPIDLFLNPTSNVEPGSPDASSTANSGSNSFSNFVARSAFHETNDTFRVDEIRIGTTFASVVPVPEPSTLLLTLGSMFGLLLFQKRR